MFLQGRKTTSNGTLTLNITLKYLYQSQLQGIYQLNDIGPSLLERLEFKPTWDAPQSRSLPSPVRCAAADRLVLAVILIHGCSSELEPRTSFSSRVLLKIWSVFSPLSANVWLFCRCPVCKNKHTTLWTTVKQHYTDVRNTQSSVSSSSCWQTMTAQHQSRWIYLPGHRGHAGEPLCLFPKPAAALGSSSLIRSPSSRRGTEHGSRKLL